MSGAAGCRPAITLPWPPKELSPNARVHFHEKARHTKAYREAAYWLAHRVVFDEDITRWTDDRPVALTISFAPPDRRRRDLDGMLASIKAGLDGIADAMRVNDQRFELNLKRAEPAPKGRVTVEIGA